MASLFRFSNRVLDMIQHRLRLRAKSSHRFYNKVAPGATVSDLFLWRLGDQWITEFPLCNLSSLCFPMAPQGEVVVVRFFNAAGDFLKEWETVLAPFEEQTLKIKEQLYGITSDVFGTFCVFHAPTLKNHFLASQTNISDRGYVSYRRNTDQVSSYTHGNTYVLSRNNDEPNQTCFVRYASWRKHTYNLQTTLDDAVQTEVFISNPTKNRQTVTITQFFPDFQTTDTAVTLGPLESCLFTVEKLTRRIALSSHVFMLRPLVFKTYVNGFDVFHG